MPLDTGKILRAKLQERRGLLVPGAANALAARIIEDLGFEAVYVSGAGVTNTLLGMPDLGFISLPEIAQHTATIREAVNIPVLVDADTGFGNALNVRHAVRVLERAGADAIQLEDQTMPKRCGHFDNKSVISAEEMVGKVKAAVDARSSHDLLIIARSDALAVEGFDRTIERAQRYIEAGADVTFVEAPQERGGNSKDSAAAFRAAGRQYCGWRKNACCRPGRTGCDALWPRALRKRRASGSDCRHAGGLEAAQSNGPCGRREFSGRQF